MDNLSQQDLDVRLQWLGCCLADKAHSVANSYRIGKNCADEHMVELQLMVALMEVLTCYNILVTGVTEVLATTSIPNFESVNSAINYAVSIDSTSIVATTAAVVDGTNLATQIAAAINAGTGTHGYTASTSGTGKMNLIIVAPVGSGATANTYIATVTTDPGGIATDVSGNFSGGVTAVEEVTEEDNCITEEEAQNIVEYLGNKCEICFAPIGYDYE